MGPLSQGLSQGIQACGHLKACLTGEGSASELTPSCGCWQDLAPHWLLAGGCPPFLTTWASSQGSSPGGSLLHHSEQEEREREQDGHYNLLYLNHESVIPSPSLFCQKQVSRSCTHLREGEYVADDKQQTRYWGSPQKLPTPGHLPCFLIVFTSSEHPERKAQTKCRQVKQTVRRVEMSGGRFGGQPRLCPSSSRLPPSRNAG